MRRFIENIIARLKKDPGYRLDTNYSSRELLVIVYYRLSQVARGFWKKLFIHSSGMLFCGSNVSIQHGYKFTCGRSCILEEGVKINALSLEGINCGNNVTIAKDAILVCTGVIANKGVGIFIGDNSAVGAQSFLGGQGGIRIGSDVIMGPQVKIFSENHNYEQADVIIRKQGESRKGVVIGDNCWIGAGCTILDGVAIGAGSVIAAGSIVTRSLPDNVIAAGVPAKVLKARTNSSIT